MELKNRKISRFRTHLDPQIGPKPRQAFDMREMGFEAELTPIGVYIKVKRTEPGKGTTEEEHVVPYANVQSIKLIPVEKE